MWEKNPSKEHSTTKKWFSLLRFQLEIAGALFQPAVAGTAYWT